MKKNEMDILSKVEAAAKENPLVRVRVASGFITDLINGALTTPRGIQGDQVCYILSVLTGIAVADVAKRKAVTDAINSSGVGESIPLLKVETESGIFWVGDAINKLLFATPMSAINVVETIYAQKNGKDNLPNLTEMIEENSKKIGDPALRVWDGSKNPYNELIHSAGAYQNIITKLEELKLTEEERVSAFAMSLGEIILKVENLFPKNLNCLHMAIETIIFFAHMDI